MIPLFVGLCSLPPVVVANVHCGRPTNPQMGRMVCVVCGAALPIPT